jgi:hypothetical protein
VLINGWSPELPVPVTPAEKAKITFVIVDVTLGRGYTSFARIERKQEKYKHLVSQLRQAGFNVTAFTRGFCSLDANDDIIAGQSIRPTEEQRSPTEAPPATDVGVLSFGVTGEIYRSTKTCLSALGIQGAEATSLLTKIHYAIINDTCSILSTRQRMDYATQAVPEQQGNGQTANRQQQVNQATTGVRMLRQPDRRTRRRTGNEANSQPDRKKRRLSGIG